LRAKFSASARPCTTPAIAIWLTIFVSCPEPAGPSKTHVVRKRANHRLRCRERPGLAADHHGELAVLRSRLSARHGRIEALDAALAARGRNLARDSRRRRRVIHVNRAAAHGCERAVGAERDRAQVRVVADAAEHDLGTARGSAGVAAISPAYCPRHLSAFSRERLYTVTAWPLRLNHPAIGNPITPRPKKATFAISVPVSISCYATTN
jgi:hypothetical protein